MLRMTGWESQARQARGAHLGSPGGMVKVRFVRTGESI